MVDFNNELPKGRPQLPADYWVTQKNKENSKQAISDFNTNRSLEDISIFKGDRNKI